jgi:hypothetical protein
MTASGPRVGSSDLLTARELRLVAAVGQPEYQVVARHELHRRAYHGDRHAKRELVRLSRWRPGAPL